MTGHSMIPPMVDFAFFDNWLPGGAANGQEKRAFIVGDVWSTPLGCRS